MRISLGDVSLWFDVSGPSVIPQGDTTVEHPVLVAVHGGPGLDHISMKSALAPLADDFQILYPDLRGHGRSDYSSPVLILAGEDDPICPLPVVEELASRLPAETTRLVRLPGARHTIFRDRPDLAFPAVRNLVSQLGESQPVS